MKITYFLYILLLLMPSCNQQKNEAKKMIAYWINKEIIIPPLSAKISDKDTIWESWSQNNYKIIHYIDTLGCTACQLKLYDWNQLISNLYIENKDVSVLIIVSLKNYGVFESEVKKNHFKYPIFYDPDFLFNSTNNLSKNPFFRTFLLDSTNHIVALGNPVENGIINKLFYKIINRTKYN